MTELHLAEELVDTFNWELVNDNIVATHRYFELHKLAHDAEGHEHRYIAKLLAKIASARGDADDNHYPYANVSDKTELLDNLTDLDVKNLTALIDHVSDPIFAGRIYDIIWLKSRPRKKTHADKVIKYYKNVEVTSDNFFGTTKFCLARAIILTSIFRDAESRSEIEQKLRSLLETHREDHGFYLHLLKFCDLFALACEEEDVIAQSCLEIYHHSIGEGHFELARRYSSFAEKKFKRLGDKANAHFAIMLQGDAWRREAESRAENAIFISNEFYGNAIQTYLKIPNADRTSEILNSIEQCKKIKQDQSAGALEQLPTFSHKQDVSELAEIARKQVMGKEKIEDAISAFCCLPVAINKNQLITMMEDSRREFPLSNLFGGSHMASDGRLVGHTQALELTEEITEHNVMNLPNFNFTANNNIALIVQGMIIPALHAINDEYHIDRILMQQFCENASMIDGDRSNLTAKALLAGFNLDFDVSVHILVPQIEHFVRSSLKQNDVVVHTSEQDNTEKLSTLNYMLYDDMAREIFDENLLFELKVLFGDEKGFNARNSLSHGFLNDGEAMSVISVYIWWRYLRLALGSMFLK